MREPGFYWVRRQLWSSDPQVARWDGEMWWQDGDDRAYCPEYDEDSTFEVLSERLTPPERLFEVGLQCSNHLAGCFERCPNCVTPPDQTRPPGQPR